MSSIVLIAYPSSEYRYDDFSNELAIIQATPSEFARCHKMRGNVLGARQSDESVWQYRERLHQRFDGFNQELAEGVIPQELLDKRVKVIANDVTWNVGWKLANNFHDICRGLLSIVSHSIDF